MEFSVDYDAKDNDDEYLLAKSKHFSKIKRGLARPRAFHPNLFSSQTVTDGKQDGFTSKTIRKLAHRRYNSSKAPPKRHRKQKIGNHSKFCKIDPMHAPSAKCSDRNVTKRKIIKELKRELG